VVALLMPPALCSVKQAGPLNTPPLEPSSLLPLQAKAADAAAAVPHRKLRAADTDSSATDSDLLPPGATLSYATVGSGSPGWAATLTRAAIRLLYVHLDAWVAATVPSLTDSF
jgi:hypothetical protein